MTLAHGAGISAGAGTVMPWPSAPSRWHSAASWPGSGLPAAIAPVSVSTATISPGMGPSTGPLASPVARMRSASSMSRRSAGGMATGSVGGDAAWRAGRAGGREGEPDEKGSVADQVQPPGAARGHGRQLERRPAR